MSRDENFNPALLSRVRSTDRDDPRSWILKDSKSSSGSKDSDSKAVTDRNPLKSRNSFVADEDFKVPVTPREGRSHNRQAPAPGHTRQHSGVKRVASNSASRSSSPSKGAQGAKKRPKLSTGGAATTSSTPSNREKKDASSDAVKCIIRIRPLNLGKKSLADDDDRSTFIGDDSSSVVLKDYKDTTYTYDHVCGEETSQEEIFELAGKSMVNSFLEGYNGTIFAYGQTGSGKTHTMQGALSLKSPSRGIIPRVFLYLFEELKKQAQQNPIKKTTVKVSFLEIYNDKISDLLNPAASDNDMKVREKSSGMYVEGLTESACGDSAQAMDCVIKGGKNRKVGHTGMNAESSRSHSVLTIHLSSTENAKTQSSRLHLIDLAGSENQKTSQSKSVLQFGESCGINLSLTHLGTMLRELAAGKQFIQYRNSKLTYMLKDSLGGNSKTCVISTVSASAKYSVETLSTLKFANQLKLVRNRAVKNLSANCTDYKVWKKEAKELGDKVKDLTKQLEEALENPPAAEPVLAEVADDNGLGAEVDDFEDQIVLIDLDLEAENTELKEEQQQLREQLERLTQDALKHSEATASMSTTVEASVQKQCEEYEARMDKKVKEVQREAAVELKKMSDLLVEVRSHAETERKRLQGEAAVAKEKLHQNQGLAAREKKAREELEQLLKAKQAEVDGQSRYGSSSSSGGNDSKLVQSLKDSEAKVAKMETQLASAREEQSGLASDLKFVIDKREELEARFETEREAAEARLKEREATITNLQQQVLRVQEMSQKDMSQINRLQNENHTVLERSQSAEQARAVAARQEDELNQLRSKLRQAEDSYNQLQQAGTNVEQRLGALIGENASLQDRCKDLSQSRWVIRNAFGQHIELAQKLYWSQAKLVANIDERDDLQQQLDQQKAKVEEQNVKMSKLGKKMIAMQKSDSSSSSNSDSAQKFNELRVVAKEFKMKNKVLTKANEELKAGQAHLERTIKGLESQLQASVVKRSDLNVKAEKLEQERQDALLKRIEGEFSGNLPLVDSSRKVIKRGMLKRVSKKQKLLTYNFFLFTDVLIYAEGGQKSQKNNVSSFTFHRALHLGLCRILDLQPDPVTKTGPMWPFSFKIISPQKSFIVSCESAKDKSAWMDAIINQIVEMAQAPIGTRVQIPKCSLVDQNNKDEQIVFKEPHFESSLSCRSAGTSAENSQSHLEYDSDTMWEEAGDFITRTRDRSGSASVVRRDSKSEVEAPATYETQTAKVNSHTYCKLCIRNFNLRRRKAVCACCKESKLCTECCGNKVVVPRSKDRRPKKVCLACFAGITQLVGNEIPLVEVCYDQ